MDKTDFMPTLIGIAVAGVITTTILVVRIHNLKWELHKQTSTAKFWRRNYERAAIKMTPMQLLAELAAMNEDIKFLNITKGL